MRRRESSITYRRFNVTCCLHHLDTQINAVGSSATSAHVRQATQSTQNVTVDSSLPGCDSVSTGKQLSLG
jgi:hypothetical protein